MSTIYRLNRAVQNPDHDRRFRYRSESIAEFPAGTMLRVYQADDGYRSIVALMGHGEAHTNPSVHRALMEAAEEAAPRTVREAMFSLDVPEYFAMDVLSVLMREGSVSIDQIMAASKTAYEEV